MDEQAAPPPGGGLAETSVEPDEQSSRPEDHAGDRWFGQQAGPAHLPSLAAAELDHTMGQLRTWVGALVDRFAIDARVIPPCWEQHNGMVEALQALRDHERACYVEDASPTAAVEWFRAFREIEARLVDLAALTHCTAHEHRLPPRAATAAPIGDHPTGGGLPRR